MAKKTVIKVQKKVSEKANSKPSAKDIDKEKSITTKVIAKSATKVVIEVDENMTSKSESDGKLTLKAASKSKTKSKTKKADKKQDDGFDDDLDDDFGESEIAEYEDDLKAVEDEDDESLDDFTEDDDSETTETEVYLTDSEGRRLCRVRDCDQVSQVDGYCRYHYLLLWKKIQIRKSILQDGKLEKYVIDLTSRYPDKFLEMIRKDLKTEKDFLSAIAELEIDESAIADESSDDDAQSFTDEIRGTVDAPSIEDDGDY